MICKCEHWQVCDECRPVRFPKTEDKAMTKELLQQALDALTRLSFLGNGDFPGNSEGNRIAQKAVADIKQALAQQETNPWSEAVIDQLVVHHIYQAAHDKDPRKAVKDLLAYSNQIALDPQVSSDAQALIDRGRREAQQEVGINGLTYDETSQTASVMGLTKKAQQEQPASVDAYVGAREDAAIWKKRALEAEELNRKFIAEVNGPTYLGEPAQQEHPAQEPVGKFLKATYGDYAVLNWHPSYVAKIGDCLYARPAPTQPSLSESDIGKACEAVSVALGSAYDCGRVWAAWSCGTMTEDDFSLVSEDPERVREIAISAIEAHCRGGVGK